jgi:hypothetical protein
MTKISISEAARLTGKPRSTLHRHIKNGKLSKEQDGMGHPVLNIAELERVYGAIQKHYMSQTAQKGQPATGQTGAMDREELAVLRREVVLLNEQLHDIRIDRDQWRQQATALLADTRAKAPKKPVEGLRVRLARWIAGNP